MTRTITRLFDNYADAVTYNSKELGYIPFLVYARNTIIIAILSVCGAVLSNSIVAYSFARIKWPGRDLFFGVTLATMMVPFPVLMVPTFALFRHLDWIGTYRPLWVPAWFGSAFSIFLLRQFFRTIPFELTEAAKLIDKSYAFSSRAYSAAVYYSCQHRSRISIPIM